MSEETYFFDTYALLEIIDKNPNYNEYLDKNMIINDFVLAELCYSLEKRNAKSADQNIKDVIPAIQHAKPEWIREAMEFRIKWKGRGVSMTDCIGYVMAKKLGIKFLTGDKEFEDLDNVEFVK